MFTELSIDLSLERETPILYLKCVSQCVRFKAKANQYILQSMQGEQILKAHALVRAVSNRDVAASMFIVCCLYLPST